jgi:hypothetical protein
MDKIDAICYINLDHRLDRKEHILEQLRVIDPALTKTHRISAEYTPGKVAASSTWKHSYGGDFDYYDKLKSKVKRVVFLHDIIYCIES